MIIWNVELSNWYNTLNKIFYHSWEILMLPVMQNSWPNTNNSSATLDLTPLSSTFRMSSSHSSQRESKLSIPQAEEWSLQAATGQEHTCVDTVLMGCNADPCETLLWISGISLRWTASDLHTHSKCFMMTNPSPKSTWKPILNLSEKQEWKFLILPFRPLLKSVLWWYSITIQARHSGAALTKMEMDFGGAMNSLNISSLKIANNLLEGIKTIRELLEWI